MMRRSADLAESSNTSCLLGFRRAGLVYHQDGQQGSVRRRCAARDRGWLLRILWKPSTRPFSNIVANPLTQERSYAGKDMPLVTWDVVDGADYLDITCSPKALALRTLGCAGDLQLSQPGGDRKLRNGLRP